MRNPFQKILVSVLILGVLISAMTPTVSYAALEGVKNILEGGVKTVSGCFQAATENGIDIFSTILDCIAYFTALGGYASLNVFGKLFISVPQLLFNYTLSLTIDNRNYTDVRIPALGEGWRFSRDLVNIFFIFILLFIAIATILGLESYGAKALLPRLIIIVLLVNFSFLATQAIIFISNSLAITFYNNIPAKNEATLSRIFVSTFTKDIGGAIIDGFGPQKLFDKKILNRVQSYKDKIDVNFAIAYLELAAHILILITGFILLLAAFLLLVRLVVLWILLILAPFGFVFLILPLTRGYATTWWTKLMNQAIFAPTFMFLLTLTIIIINSSFMDFLGKASEVEEISVFISLAILQSIFTGALLIASILVSKAMGVYGAGAVVGWAKSGGKLFRGYGGKLFKRYAAPRGERVATGTERTRLGRVMGTVTRAIPGMQRVAAAVSTLDKKEIEALEKRYGTYTDAALRSLSESPGWNLLSRVHREAIRNVQTQRTRKTRRNQILQSERSTSRERLAAMAEELEEAETEREAAEAERAEAAAELATERARPGEEGGGGGT